MKAFFPIISKLPTFKDTKVSEEIISNALDLIKYHPMSWDYIPDIQDFDDFIKKDKWSFLELYDEIYSKYAEYKKKEGYFVKENFVFDYADKIADTYRDVYFIYLVRDPRDVFLSFKKIPGGPKTALYGGNYWNDEQNKCLDILENSKFRTLQVRYEDLIEETEKLLRECCKFINIKYDPEILKGNDREGKSSSPFWKNLSKQVIKTNKNKFMKELSIREIAIIESICKDNMQRFGYELETSGDFKMNEISKVLSLPKNTILNIMSFITKLDTKERQIRIQRRKIYKRINSLVVK